MRRLPPLNALQIFATVARHRSFTRAADALCVTQGAISRQIQSLEAHYGFALFMRHARGLTLTVEGEQLLPVVVESFARIEDISLKLTRQRTDLALKVPTCVMRWVLPRIMRFQREHPDLHVQMTTTWRHDVDFQSEPFDAAIVYGISPGPDVAAVPLFDERLTPVCAPDLLEGRPLARVEDLACHTLLHPTRDHRDWRRWLDYAGAAGVDPDRGPSFDSLDLATSAATQGFLASRWAISRSAKRISPRGGSRCRSTSCSGRGRAITSSIRRAWRSSRRFSASVGGSTRIAIDGRRARVARGMPLAAGRDAQAARVARRGAVDPSRVTAATDTTRRRRSAARRPFARRAARSRATAR